MALSGLILVEELYAGPTTRVLRVRRSSVPDSATYIAKTLAEGTYTTQTRARLLVEYHTLEALAAAGVPHVMRPVELLEKSGSIAWLAEDVGGKALRLLTEPLSVHEVLSIGERVSEALAGMHAERLLHKDVNPNNIIYNPQTDTVRVIDLGIATSMGVELQDSDAFEGTIPYMAPEQTGRLNRVLDNRADLYSLGATLYELLCGTPPFVNEDTQKLMYSILTHPAPDVRQRNPHCPVALAQIIAKLLAKAPEARYQSADGLRQDLLRCLKPGQADAPFELGLQDHSEQFSIPPNLYGREAQVAALQALYVQSATGRARTVLVTGPSGIGKSALVQTLQQRMVGDQALYAEGKYDPLRRHVPFNAFDQAISGLIRQILRSPPALLDAWKRRVQEAVGALGSALGAVAPAVLQLLGKQAPLVELGPRENENRLLWLLQRFVRALSAKQPLVLFLDDMQWADSGSLKLLALLDGPSPNGGGLLVVVAYRSDEVKQEHPLAQTLLHMTAARAQTNAPNLPHLLLEPMRQEAIVQLVRDTTGASVERATPLAERLLSKTAGNPFFVRQFLRELWHRALITYNRSSQQWDWDLAAIDLANVTDNVVLLLKDKLRTLNAAELHTLTIAACMGNEFQAVDLAKLQERPVSEVMTYLQTALRTGLLMAVGSGHRYVSTDDGSATLRFAHDRVQEAAYSMLDPEAAEATHHRLGMAIWDAHISAPPGPWLFKCLDHLNRAPEALTDGDLRIDVASLNLTAALHANKASVYQAAQTYLHHALAMLPGDAWQTHYALMRDIQVQLAENEYLTSQRPQASARLDQVLTHVQHAAERALVHRRRMLCLSAIGRSGESVLAGIAALAELGMNIPDKPGLPAILTARLRLSIALRGRNIEALADAPEATDPRVVTIAQILSELHHPAYSCAPQLFVLVTLLDGLFNVQHGNTPTAAFTFSGLAGAYHMLNQHARARAFAAAAQRRRAQKPGPLDGRSELVALMFVEFSTLTPYQLVESYWRAGGVAMQAGDTTYGLLGSVLGAVTLSFVDLDDALDHTERLCAAYSGKEDDAGLSVELMRQYLRCMKGLTESPLSWTDSSMSEEAIEERINSQALEASRISYYNNRGISIFLHGDSDSAYRHIQTSVDLGLFRSTGGQTAAVMAFYLALSLWDMAQKHGRMQHSALVRQAMGNVSKIAALDPKIFGGLHVLLRAEQAAYRGQQSLAQKLYQACLQPLLEAGYTVHAAIAYERAGRYYLRSGLAAAAEGHLIQALTLYRRWGGRAKVQLLEREFSLQNALTGAAAAQTHASKTPGRRHITHTSATHPLNLDAKPLLAMTDALAQEPHQETLVPKLLHTLREVGGATRVALFVRRSENLQRVGDTSGEAAPLADQVVHYVGRAQEAVAIDDLQRDNPFKQDPYLARGHTRTLVCMPLLRLGRLCGAVYLENDQAAGALAPSRLAAVRIVATQAVLLLDYADLLRSLDRRVEERTEDVRREHAQALQVERDSAGMQVAGGLAHEIRNALAPALYTMTAALQPPDGILDHHRAALRQLETSLKAGDVTQALASVQAVFEHGALLEEVLKQVRPSLQRGMALTEQTLDYAQAAKILPGDYQTAAKPLLENVLHELRASLEDAHIAVELHADPAMQLPMQAPHAHTILRHLLLNARDALSQTDSPRRVVLRAGRVQGQVVVSVMDNGCGMPSEVQDKVFQPFFSTKGVNGRGLGLGLSRKLVQVYGGTLDFVSETDQGSTFQVRLPGPETD